MNETRDQGIGGARDQGPQASRPTGARWLQASALVLLGLVLARAFPLLGGGEARAEMVARSGSYIVMTTDGGNEEILVVIDERSDTISVYKVVNQRSAQLFQRADLRDIFVAARAQRLGRG